MVSAESPIQHMVTTVARYHFQSGLKKASDLLTHDLRAVLPGFRDLLEHLLYQVDACEAVLGNSDRPLRCARKRRITVRKDASVAIVAPGNDLSAGMK